MQQMKILFRQPKEQAKEREGVNSEDQVVPTGLVEEDSYSDLKQWKRKKN